MRDLENTVSLASSTCSITLYVADCSFLFIYGRASNCCSGSHRTRALTPGTALLMVEVKEEIQFIVVFAFILVVCCLLLVLAHVCGLRIHATGLAETLQHWSTVCMGLLR